MSCTPRRSRRLACAIASVYTAATFCWLVGCGLTVSQERPSYAELEPHEQNVVQIVLSELRGFNAQVEARTKYSIAGIIDQERINVSFEGNIFAGNLGDGVIHVAPWENLDAGQHALVAAWFGSSEAAAKASYEKLFYRFLAVAQGAKQYQYEALGVKWIYANRSIYNVERDSIRETLSYYRTIGKQADMWNFATGVCKNILVKYKVTFEKKYLQDNLQTLANPKAPSGYMYYICRFIEMGKVDAVDLTTELLWVPTIPTLSKQE